MQLLHMDYLPPISTNQRHDIRLPEMADEALQDLPSNFQLPIYWYNHVHTLIDHGYTPVAIDLPFKSAQTLTLYRMTGDAFAHNLTAENVTVEKLPLGKRWRGKQLVVNAATGGDDRGLPPSSAFLYVFEEVAESAQPWSRKLIRAKQLH